jgi:LPXTG-site transpeptidase (sortase) family protein
VTQPDERDEVVRHRSRRLNPAHRRAAFLLCCVLALSAPIAVTAAVLVGTQEKAKAGRATWVVPGRLDLVPDPALSAGPPTRVRIPSIAVDSGLESLTMDAAGALRAPATYTSAGWFSQGTPPGDVGPAVIAGHVDSKTGPAVFYRLRELKSGAQVQVERSGKWLTFQVTAVQRYPKTKFPSTSVYGPTPDAELRLITCGGTFDTARNSYRDNVVAFAVLV